MNREEALAEIASIAKNHNLTSEEIKAALVTTPEKQATQSSQMMNTLFGYVGSLLVFAGICIFIGMQWDEINTINRIFLTLGVGFCLFVLAVVFTKHTDYDKSAGPLFLMAAILQPTGLVILVNEYAPLLNPSHAVLFISLLMLIQQGFTFLSTRRTDLALLTIIFGMFFFIAACDVLAIPYKTEWLSIGISLLCLAWVINRTRYQTIAAVLFFFGSLVFLLITFDIVRNKSYEILYLGLSCYMIFLAILSNSRTLLINATLATLAYIGYFTGQHFPHTIGWPFTLILMGFILIIFSSIVIKLNRYYLKS